MTGNSNFLNDPSGTYTALASKTSALIQWFTPCYARSRGCVRLKPRLPGDNVSMIDPWTFLQKAGLEDDRHGRALIEEPGILDR